MIQTDAQLESFLPVLNAAEWTAVDTEADSLHAYPEKLCLIQISVPGRDVLIDPLARVNLRPLWAALMGRELLLHGGDYDVRLIHRTFGFVPRLVFDTMIAARLIGATRFSLSDLVSHYLGIALEKGSQKANWARRPLTEKMADYARNDTRHLRPLSDFLRTALREKGRIEWCQEACERMVADSARITPPDPDTVWRIKGSGRLRPDALAILREIWHWREREATAANLPPYFILAHEAMVDIAQAAAHAGEVEPHIPRSLTPRRRHELMEAVQRGLSVPSGLKPQPIHSERYHPTRTERTRFDQLKKRRDDRASELGIDPTLVASRQTLEFLSRERETVSAQLMSWQRRILLEA